jgi:hypothetical protein
VFPVILDATLRKQDGLNLVASRRKPWRGSLATVTAKQQCRFVPSSEVISVPSGGSNIAYVDAGREFEVGARSKVMRIT